PSAWPLTQRGFVTREHLGRIPGQHPGIDIAVAEGSYVRAAGAGVVTDSDPESEHQECQNKARALLRAAEEAVRFAGRGGLNR
ncbi:MAG: hypothetical protein HOL02_05800, partial [Rhodospirillaceae bacterium]|nr:hypothetical protein [Rhodospirillaceae bacterium]